MKIRFFLAFSIPADIQLKLNTLIQLMAEKAPGIKWVDPKLIHGTIKFFGDVEEGFLLDQISSVIERNLRGMEHIHLQVVGLSVFPNWRYPKVIWAGLSGDTERAANLHYHFEEILLPLGVPKDERTFRLHLTLGRVNGAPLKNAKTLTSFLEKQVGHEFGTLTVDRLTLYKSVLTKNGPQYTSLKEFPFQASLSPTKESS
ncbi:MAG: 2'-5' RNA ligase [Deltaproteobacteria bacterium RIFCSPLOWO2_02_FULL_44_10]|nr:MAG: 2'-5' RNA ligase [Deltaproteobacteria bacterium RIFCSPHIGHO2_02_FULL_44_16]OGQ46433.1 MAG: 2'-5' RNA ligase [Deltaproteobacteria bacterium RIFCSPLOWO2_02_FULL_44_10]